MAISRLKSLLLSLGLSTLSVAAVLFILQPQASASTPEFFVAPSVLYIAPDGDCNGASPCYGNLQDAVDAALPFDEVRMAAGVYTDTDTGLRGSLAQIDVELTITGGYTTTDWTTAYGVS